MDILYRRGRATAAEVLAELPDPPSYSSVRTLLAVLEQKGHLRHEQDGARYVFIPTVSRGQARRRALSRLVGTFFAGSPEDAAAALLDQADLSREALDRLERRLLAARRKHHQS